MATCQVCAREIKAKTGLIAHHGYMRPGQGWQTSSCLGARHRPYEDDKGYDALIHAIEVIGNYKLRMETLLQQVLNGEIFYISKRGPMGRQWVLASKEEWEALPVWERSYGGSNDPMYADHLRGVIKQSNMELELLQKRYNDHHTIKGAKQ